MKREQEEIAYFRIEIRDSASCATNDLQNFVFVVFVEAIAITCAKIAEAMSQCVLGAFQYSGEQDEPSSTGGQLKTTSNKSADPSLAGVSEFARYIVNTNSTAAEFLRASTWTLLLLLLIYLPY